MFKGIVWFFVVVILFELINIVFKDKFNELRNENIDKYNFQQLEIVKTILDNLDRNSYNFSNLSEFNELYKQKIIPKKNCYFIADRNRFFKDKKWWWGYIFWFKLESDKYINIYWTWYYVYPKYDLPIDNIYFWFWWWNDRWINDRIYNNFVFTISNPCQD